MDLAKPQFISSFASAHKDIAKILQNTIIYEKWYLGKLQQANLDCTYVMFANQSISVRIYLCKI